MQGAWTKMWDPPGETPALPERLAPTNPVPAFMEQTLGQDVFRVDTPNVVQRRLLHGLTLRTWDDAKDLEFMTFRDSDDREGAGHFPGATIRVPRGAIFHCLAQASGPPPHTIHWHGQEPTPMNDGVGHCSMEIDGGGDGYTYQLQPNFIGTYFYHCHRNTVQHFEFGLYGMFLVEPPDAFEGPNAGGYPRRTAANLENFSKFDDKYVDGDSTWGVAGPLDGALGNPDPHAFTVEYDVEALWVLDDRDSVWSDLAKNAKAFYPGGAFTEDGHFSDEAVLDTNPPVAALPVNRPGVDDQFPKGFFHDFNADYWFVTGVPVPAHKGGTASIPSGTVVPPVLNSGVTGMQVDVNAEVDQVVLIRVLNAAYNRIEVTFPVDVVIIAFDGRALGVPPFARYNQAFELKAGTPYHMSTARRFDALIRATSPINSFAEVKFFSAKGPNAQGVEPLLVTARIPIVINEPAL
jgi:FtsP/CotA-like multicopper oxidase with cupredoxin domain